MGDRITVLAANTAVRITCLVLLAVAITLPVWAFRVSTPHLSHGQTSTPRAGIAPTLARTPAISIDPLQSGIPILTFHDIANRPDPYSVTPAHFEAEMQLLHDRGFHPISADQMANFVQGTLPKLPRNPILITFDDGIGGTYQYADPILKRYGFQATVFVIARRVGTHHPYYLTWPEIEKMHASGRWSIESHTWDGHRAIVTDAKGDMGAFLTNREWLPSKHRVETIDEYHERIHDDFQHGIADFAKHGLPRPRGFAYPFSAYTFPTNDPAVPKILEAEVNATFDFAATDISTPTFAKFGEPNLYVPRIEVFNGTSLSSLYEQIQRANDSGSRELIYPELAEGSITEANHMLAGEWTLPRAQAMKIPMPPTWHEGSGQTHYWNFIYASLRPTSNLLYAWQQTGEQQYLTGLESVLASYTRFDATRGTSAPTFDDPHATAYRLMVLTNSYWKLKRAGQLAPSLDAALQHSIAKDAAFLVDPAHFQGDENHGFNEAAALLDASANFPDMAGASEWGTIANQRLATLMTTVVDPDGVEIENSPFYHYYVLSGVSSILAWASHNDVTISPVVSQRAAAMMRYATLIPQPDGKLPLLGGTVSTDITRIDPAIYDDLAAKYPQFAWIRSDGDVGTAPTDVLALFRSAGLAILHSGFGSADGVRLGDEAQATFDMGPYRTQHSDLDALSLTWFAGHRELLPDSGLYTIQNGPGRTYFHGTSAHNTVVVDGHNQEQGSGTIGLGKIGPGWRYQSGSESLNAGVTHHRGVLVLGRSELLVLDQLTSAAKHTFTQTWHVDPDLTSSTSGASVAAKDAHGTSDLRIDQALPTAAPTIVRGQTKPALQGWYSSEYGVKQPNDAVQYTATGTSASWVTLLSAGADAATTPAVHATVQGSSDVITICSRDVHDTITIRDLGQPDESITVTPATTCPSVSHP